MASGVELVCLFHKEDERGTYGVTDEPPAADIRIVLDSDTAEDVSLSILNLVRTVGNDNLRSC